MQKSLKAAVAASMVALVAACSDGPFEPVAADYRPLMDLEHTPMEFMSNYVSIGTSLSMGWASDGVLASSQAVSWTKQLADRLHAPNYTFPAIASPGCQPPFAAPLYSFRRIDNSSALTRSPVCAPNEDGVTLPTHNLAVENATAGEALTGTPETASQGRQAVTSRVLRSGMTQVSTLQTLNPTFVSVEFGGNEILPAQVGLLVPGVTYTPFEVFQANYARIIDAVKSTGAKAVLATIRSDLRNFPAIRTGPEIAAQREAFRAYNVSVNANCDESPNFLFVRGIVPTAILRGAGMKPFGVPFDLSCADRPGAPDFILTPKDIAFINDLADRMSAEIERHAEDNGYAVFALGSLYNIAKDGVPFDLESYLHSDSPYGELISLDGVHPNAAGQAIFAKAAAKAIRKTYTPGNNANNPTP